MATVDELEAALQARWDLDTLAVYADALQSLGDPRGELIALDLDPSQRASARRHQRVRAWLRSDVFRPEAVEYGLLDILFTERTLATLDRARIAPYVRQIRMNAATPALAVWFRRLVERRWPWLQRLQIACSGPDAEPLHEHDTHKLVAAAPHLATLCLAGPRIFDTVAHPTVRRLELRGDRAFGELALPAVEELEIMLFDSDTGELARRTASLPLRLIDLAHNEGHRGVLAFLAALPVPERLGALRLPSLRRAEEGALVRELVERVPGLEVTIARAYTRYADATRIVHPRVRAPDPVPCPPPDVLDREETLAIGREQVPAIALAAEVSAAFAALPTNARATWTAFWTLFDALPLATDGAFARDTLQEASAALPAGFIRDCLVRALAETAETITIRRSLPT